MKLKLKAQSQNVSVWRPKVEIKVRIKVEIMSYHMILDRYNNITLNCNNFVDIEPREMILPSLESSHQGESNRKEFIEIQLLDAEIIDLEVY